MGNTEQITESNLAQFIGTEHHYTHGLMRAVHYTDGVRFLETNGAAWLVDAIASHQLNRKVNKEPFQSWTLRVKDNSAVLEATDGNYKVITRQKIEYTDFPLEEVKFFVVDDEYGGKMIMLTSEY